MDREITTERQDTKQPSNTNPQVKVCLIGAGNVATHLAKALAKQVEITQIYSRNLSNSQQLASLINKPDIAISSLKDINTESDFYIVSVKDDEIANIADNTPNSGIWAHTSGSIPMSVFEKYKSRYGVFYPLQTFSKNVRLNISEVPFFIEGNSDLSFSKLFALAKQISKNVTPADSSRRKSLHIAAVFACNFANYMWILSDKLLQTDGLNINYLMPLLQETLNKLKILSPIEAMTGPARRGDTQIIKNHLDMLSGDEKEIYKMLSENIIKLYHPSDKK